MSSGLMSLVIALAIVLAAGRFRRVALLLTFVWLVVLIPRPVIAFDPSGLMLHVGTAYNDVRIYNFEVVALLALVMAWPSVRRIPRATFIPFIVLLVVLTGVSWGTTPLVLSGVMHSIFACVAFYAGARLGSSKLSDREVRYLVLGLLVLVVSQLVIGLLALRGLQLPLVTQTDNQFVAGRLAGTTNHPNTLGKFLALFTMVLLPLTRTAAARSRRLAWATIILAIAAGALTGGRAVLLGMGALIALWVLLARRPEGAKTPRIFQLGALLLIVAPFAPTALARFSEDPEGGSRPLLLQAFWENIGHFVLTGLGPNTYVETFSEFSAVTAARQLPVHNGFLISLGEFGLFCWLAFWIPIAYIYLRPVLRVLTAGDTRSPNAVTLAISLPMLLILLVTGWGMVGGAVLTIWLLVTGFMSQQAAVDVESNEDEVVPEPVWAGRR